MGVQRLPHRSGARSRVCAPAVASRRAASLAAFAFASTSAVASLLTLLQRDCFAHSDFFVTSE
jgi:hypothetical protein